MKKRMVLFLILLAAAAALPRPASAAPDKSAAKLEVTYYYLPT
jgi:hypothetical protein